MIRMHGLLHRLAGVDLYREHAALRYGLALFFVLAALAANFERISGAVSNLLAPTPANMIIVAPTGSEKV